MVAKRGCALLLCVAAAEVFSGAAAGVVPKKCKKGARATTACFFAAGSDSLAEFVETFVEEGFET